MQINLQHSRIATDNFQKVMDEEQPDIICKKGLYITGSKIGRVPRFCTSGEGKKALGHSN